MLNRTIYQPQPRTQRPNPGNVGDKPQRYKRKKGPGEPGPVNTPFILMLEGELEPEGKVLPTPQIDIQAQREFEVRPKREHDVHVRLDPVE